MFNYFQTDIYLSHPFDIYTNNISFLKHSEKDNVFHQKQIKTKGKPMFFTKNKLKPEENQCFSPKTN